MGANAVSVHTRRVAGTLRELRRRSGLSAPEVSQALGISMSKISRMESGQRRLKADDVAAMLGLYRVRSEERQEILDMVRTSGSSLQWTVRGVPAQKVWADLMYFERESIVLHCYETMLFPGLLQTPGYTRAMAEALAPTSPDIEIEDLLAQRVERQMLLHSSREFEFLFEQSVLDRLIGDAEVMRFQLQRISAIADRPNVSVQVVPTDTGAHAGLVGPFLYFEFEENPDLLLCETRSSASYVEDEESIADAGEALRSLRKVALSPEDSAELIERTAQRWSRQC